MTPFAGAARRLQPGEIEAAARTLGCATAALQAVLAVETSGHGFDAQGRPAMLFEPHRFYAEFAGAPAVRAKAVAAGLAYPVWRQGYPPDSYPRLLAAVALDRTAALRAASWGLGQVLGSNCTLCGAVSVEAMVADAANSEAAQLGHMVGFIRARGLAAALGGRDWARFASGYNGTAYRQNAYDTKLAAAYARLAGTIGPAVVARVPVVARANMSTDDLNDASLARALATA